MKSAALLFSIAALALTAPAIADARPDNGNGGQARAERQAGRPDRGAQRQERPRQDGPARNRPDQNRPNPNRPNPDRPRQDRGPDGYRNRPDIMAPQPDYRPRRDSLGAGWRQQQNEVRQGVRSGRYVPLARVLPNLQRRFPGRQLDAGIEDDWQGRPVYRVRWAATNGRRIDFIVDAQTGAILDAQGQ